jgi:hypothetical protein
LVAQFTAPVVRFARGPANGYSSVNVVLGHSRSAQRARHIWPTAAAPVGRRECDGVGPARSPRPTATTPQLEQPATSSPVSTPRTSPAGGCRDGADVDALDTEQRVRARAPTATGTRHRDILVRVFWVLVAWLLPIQRGPDLFPSPPRRSGNGPPCAAVSDRPNHAHLRRS